VFLLQLNKATGHVESAASVSPCLPPLGNHCSFTHIQLDDIITIAAAPIHPHPPALVVGQGSVCVRQQPTKDREAATHTTTSTWTSRRPQTANRLTNRSASHSTDDRCGCLRATLRAPPSTARRGSSSLFCPGLHAWILVLPPPAAIDSVLSQSSRRPKNGSLSRLALFSNPAPALESFVLGPQASVSVSQPHPQSSNLRPSSTNATATRRFL
jgi:hypothetical protein